MNNLKPLLRFRIAAYVTGALLLGLTIAVIGKFTIGYHQISFWSKTAKILGFIHGWGYLIYVFLAIDLAIKVRLEPLKALAVMLCGTIPGMSFVAERKLTQKLMDLYT